MKKEKQSRYIDGALSFGHSCPRVFNKRRVFLHCHDEFSCGDAQWDEACNEETCLENKIGLGIRFYYQIEEFRTEENKEVDLKSWERGVGYLEEVDDRTCLYRETPVKLWNGDGGEAEYYRPESEPMEFSHHSILRIQSKSPTEFREATAAPYSIVATMEPQRLCPVHLEENTLIGRKDDIVQSIDREELMEMYNLGDLAIDSLTKTQKQLLFSARRIDLKRKDSVISAPVLKVSADTYTNSTKPPAQQGMIIYNSDTKCLEFYNGEEWISLGGNG